MKIINEIKNNLDLKIHKYSFKNKIRIIDTDKGTYVIKEIKDKDIYTKLINNRFDNFIEPKYFYKNYELIPFIEDIEKNKNEKAKDLINIISKLHLNSSYYEEISIDNLKEYYELIKKKIKDLNKYYDDIRIKIEDKEYPSPSELYLIKNISIIFISLDICNELLDKYYDIKKETLSIRKSIINNNLDIDHLIENEHKYLISWNKYTYDEPIKDFIYIYKKEFNNLDFNILLESYINNIKLSKDEFYKLFIELLLPEKIYLNKKEVKNIYDVTYQNIYLLKTYKLYLKYNKVDKKNK